MIRRHKSSLVLFLCLQAMAVAIICFGSLINFHQYKIWGKPLITNFVGYKRDIEKHAKTVSFSKLSPNNQNVQKDFSGTDFDCTIEISRLNYGSTTEISYLLTPFIPVSTRISSSGLRGPPIS